MGMSLLASLTFATQLEAMKMEGYCSGELRNLVWVAGPCSPSEDQRVSVAPVEFLSSTVGTDVTCREVV